MPSKRKRKNDPVQLQNYSLSPILVDHVKSKKALSQILNVVQNIKRKQPKGKGCWNRLIDRNMLICAAWYGHGSVIDYVLCKWKTQQQFGQSKRIQEVHENRLLSFPMCLAAFQGHTDIVVLLLNEVGNINHKIPKNKLVRLDYWQTDGIFYLFGRKELSKVSALDFVLITDNLDMLKAISYHPSITTNWRKVFFRACVFCSVNCATYMLHEIDEFRQIASFRYTYNDNTITPLMVASQKSYALTKLLLEAGVNVNDTDKYRRNALHFAVAPTCLLEELADRYNSYGKKPLMGTYVAEEFSICQTNEYQIVPHNYEELKEKTTRLRPLSVVMNQFGLLSLMYIPNVNMLTFNQLQFPNENEVIHMCKVMDKIVENLIDCECLYNSGKEELPVNTWYLSSLQFFKCVSKFIQFRVPHLVQCHYMLQIVLKVSLTCLEKLFKSGYSQKMSSNADPIDITNLFKKVILVISLCKCYSSEYKGDLPVCQVNTNDMGVVSNQVAGYKSYLSKLLELLYSYGISLKQSMSIIELSNVAHLIGSQDVLPEVLSVLCSLPHKFFYKAISVLEEDSIVDSSDSEEYLEDDFLDNQSCLRSSIRELQLGQNPRPLCHMARIVIFESLNRCFIPGVYQITPSKIIQQYLISFSYY